MLFILQLIWRKNFTIITGCHYLYFTAQIQIIVRLLY